MELLEGKTMGTPSPDTVSTKLQRIAELARQAPKMALTTLSHHIDIEFLREAHRRTRKDGAVGVDGQTADEYATDLEANLQSLLNRFKSGTYRAPPVLRVHIPKGSGRGTRPIGIPAFEDKVLQRAVAMVLEAVYEQDFLDCSYGFRPGRSTHQMVESLRRNTMGMGGGWVVEVDMGSDLRGSDVVIENTTTESLLVSSNSNVKLNNSHILPAAGWAVRGYSVTDQPRPSSPTLLCVI